MFGGPFRLGMCRFLYSTNVASSRLYCTARTSPFRRLDSTSIASSSTEAWVRAFFPIPLAFPGRGVLSSSSKTTKSGVGSRLRFLALGSSALSDSGSSSDQSLGTCFPRAFSRCCEPELRALPGGWET